MLRRKQSPETIARIRAERAQHLRNNEWKWDLETWDFGPPDTLQMKWPNPPHTTGKDPETWPTANQLPLDVLAKHLAIYEVRELRARNDPAGISPMNRRALNRCLYELRTEAVKRGLR